MRHSILITAAVLVVGTLAWAQEPPDGGLPAEVEELRQRVTQIEEQLAEYEARLAVIERVQGPVPIMLEHIGGLTHIPPEYREKIRRLWGYEQVHLITNCWIESTDAPGVWDPTLTKQLVESSKIPSDYDGWIILDWEGEWTRRLCGPKKEKGWVGGPGSPEFTRARIDGIMLARSVKEWWPNAKVGFYALPLIHYWEGNDEPDYEERMMEALHDVIAQVDGLFPSLYQCYGPYKCVDGEKQEGETSKPRWRKRHQRLIRLALKLATHDGKHRPVIPFIKSRWHPSAKPPFKDPDSEIICQQPAEFFREVAEMAHGVQVGLDRIDGFCQYGAMINCKTSDEADRVLSILWETMTRRPSGIPWTDVEWPECQRTPGPDD